MKKLSFTSIFTIVILCIAIFFSFSLLSLHPHSDECHSSDCAICTITENYKNILRSLLLLIFTYWFQACIFHYIGWRDNEYVNPLSTLIDLKVKLSN